MPEPSTIAALKVMEGLIGEGRFEEAVRLGEEVVGQEPLVAEGWFWLGHVYLLVRELGRAERALARAVRLAPGHALAWTNLSIVALALARSAEAESHARQAIALDAANDAHWVNFGNALLQQGRWPEAAEAYRQAVARQPQNAAAWGNLATVAEQQGDLAAAQEAYERHLTLAPSPEAAVMYAALLNRRAQPQQAAHVLRQVVEQIPTMAAAWQELASALTLSGVPAEAEAAGRRALELDPASLRARQSLALALLAQFRFAEAEPPIRQLLAADPTSGEAWALLSSVQLGQAKTAEALDSGRRAVALAPDATRHSRLLTTMQYVEDVGPEALLAEHCAWDESYARALMPTGPPVVRPRDRSRPLRIGLLSANFGRHPIAFLALPALAQLDKSRCSIVYYSDRLDDDLYTPRFRAASDVWHTTACLSDAELAQQIRQDEIDVLIDLMGHTGPRLLTFARRPAPVQATWLGYVGTTGVAAIDFLLADRYHVRPGEKARYSETILRLPNRYVCYGPPDYAPEIGELPAAASGRVTFGSFNNPAKLTPRLLDAWAAILQRVPTAQLLLRFGGLDEPRVQAPIYERLARHRIARERILMEGNSPHPELLAAYGRVDLALDTQPYSGGATTCEALWMGVPVITWPGRTFAGRHSTSYLTTAGLTEFIADDVAGYIYLAVQWANRLDELAVLRRSLRERMRQSPLCDFPRFANDMLALLTRAIDERAAKAPA
jgi:protein O-GlcNAc transferase